VENINEVEDIRKAARREELLTSCRDHSGDTFAVHFIGSGTMDQSCIQQIAELNPSSIILVFHFL